VTYAYAADGTLTSVTGPVGGITRYTATPDNKFQVTDPDGNTVVSNTPATGRVTHQDFPTGGHADFTHDTGPGPPPSPASPAPCWPSRRTAIPW
jgi:uncharacterized protein RhaS with RHS repeats